MISDLIHKLDSQLMSIVYSLTLCLTFGVKLMSQMAILQLTGLKYSIRYIFSVVYAYQH